MSCGGCAKIFSVEYGNVIRINDDIEAVPEDSNELKIQILNVLKQRGSKWIVLLITCNSIVIYFLWKWSISTDSLALKAYVNTLVFNVCALAVCLISIWVEQNTLQKFSRRPWNTSQLPQRKCHRSLSSPAAFDLATPASRSDIALLGPEKYEVLALLLSSCFSLITGFLLALDAVGRIREQPLVHEGRLGLGAVLGLVAHIVTIVAHPDAGLNHVVCKALPCPTLKGVNPILGGNLISFAILCGVHAAIHFWELYTVDTAAAFAVIGLTVASMLPLAFYTASIILQKLSHHMSEQLDKCLREALIIDGVLEFRNERFWTKSFGKLAGSLEVRIRKNADEHYVLGKVVKRLSQVVSTLSVQEFREPSSSSSLAHNFSLKLPLEYYVDELLQRGTDGEIVAGTEKEEADEETGKSVKIEEILGCGNPASSERGARQSDGREPPRSGYATLWRNDEDCALLGRSYLLRSYVPVKNALLLGSRRDLDDLECSTRICCQV